MLSLKFEGLDMQVYRSKRDGKLVVDIASTDLRSSDAYENGVPKLRVVVNEDTMETDENGCWVSDAQNTECTHRERMRAAGK